MAAGAVQLTDTDVPLTLFAVPMVGAPGVPTVIELLAAEGSPVPLALMADTVKVYAVPVVSPVKTQEVDDPLRLVEQAAGVVTDGLDVTVYPVMPEPPVTVGAVQVTVAEVAEVVAEAVPMVGAPGAPTVIELDGAEAGLFPLPFLATTVNV